MVEVTRGRGYAAAAPSGYADGVRQPTRTGSAQSRRGRKGVDFGWRGVYRLATEESDRFGR